VGASSTSEAAEMASNAGVGDSAVLDLEQVGSTGLQFTSTTGVSPSSTTHTFTGNVPDSAIDQDEDDSELEVDSSNDKKNLIKDDAAADEHAQPKPTNYNFMTLAFYRQFFDVSTVDVQERLVWSLTPRPSSTADFVRKRIRPNPDLYGPFWVCVTLIFSVAISGNVASYLQKAVGQEEEKSFRWHYDFHKVTLAATAVFGYAWLVPAGLYMAMWAKAENIGGGEGAPPGAGQVSLIELLCVYGYSLSIFIPVSVLWTIQSAWLQWCLVGAAGAISGAVLVLALWNNTVKDSGVRKNVGFVLIGVVIVLHVLLAMGFMLYFFHVPNGPLDHHDNASTATTASSITSTAPKTK